MEKNPQMIVEIPQGTSNKYEFDIINQKWKLDRVLAGAMFYPTEYGFFPETLDKDGDPLDVICLVEKSTFPGCYVPVRIVGVLKMIDGDEEDDKILAVNAVDSRFQNINELKDISQNKLNEISNFFARYKELEKKPVIIQGWEGKEKAYSALTKCQNWYQKYQDLIKQGIEKRQLVKVLKKES